MTKLIFIDTELSGMRAFDEVIEFAAIEVDVTGGVQTAPKVIFDSIIRGAIDIETEQTKLTGLNLEELNSDSSYTIGKVIDLFVTNQNAIFVSYGLQFDLDWIQHSAMLNQEEAQLKLRGICLLEAVTKQIGHPIGMDQFLNITRDVHRALPDAKLHQLVLAKLNRENLQIKDFIGGIPKVLS